jgi:hypothetical protein
VPPRVPGGGRRGGGGHDIHVGHEGRHDRGHDAGTPLKHDVSTATSDDQTSGEPMDPAAVQLERPVTLAPHPASSGSPRRQARRRAFKRADSAVAAPPNPRRFRTGELGHSARLSE